MTETKHCPRCDRDLPFEAYYFNKSRANGLSPYCIECHGAHTAERALARRLALIADLGGKCVRCGFDDHRALQIDHVNSDGKLDRVEFPNTRSARFYKNVREHPERYMLLCANCNWIKRYEANEMFGKRTYVRRQAVRKPTPGRHNPEANAQRSASMKEYAKGNPAAVAARGRKTSRTATGRKLVVGEDGKKHWQYPDGSVSGTVTVTL